MMISQTRPRIGVVIKLIVEKKKNIHAQIMCFNDRTARMVMKTKYKSVYFFHMLLKSIGENARNRQKRSKRLVQRNCSCSPSGRQQRSGGDCAAAGCQRELQWY